MAILCGELFEAKAGAALFATNTSALRDIPAIRRSLVTASLDVASMTIDDRASGRFEAKVNPVLARTVTAFYFQVREGYAAKEVLGGTLKLTIGRGSVVSGMMTLEGADVVGGVRALNRYVVTISSP